MLAQKRELLNSSTHLYSKLVNIICRLILLHFHLIPSVPLHYFNSERELFICSRLVQFFIFFFFNINYFLVNCGFIYACLIPGLFYTFNREHHPPNLTMDLKRFFETNTFKNSSSWQML